MRAVFCIMLQRWPFCYKLRVQSIRFAPHVIHEWNFMSTFSDKFAIILSRISLSKVNVEMYQQKDREREDTSLKLS